MKRWSCFGLFIGILVIALYFIGDYFGIIPRKIYTAEYFGIETRVSNHDENQNGVDDYMDLVLGARKDAEARPTYKSAYYSGGYPPENEGVCTDMIWRAFAHAGYSLKDLVDQDIREHPDEYPYLDRVPDSNIDFRRVGNLYTYLKRNAFSLTLDPSQIEEWQPGDIVIFGDDYRHIGIISNKRNRKGIPYLLHNAGQYKREEDALVKWDKKMGISGHFRLKIEY